MKFEEKQIQLFKSIAKFVVLGGVFLWLLQEMIALTFGVTGTYSAAYPAFILIADILAMIAMLGYVGKLFFEKYATILDSIFQIGLLLYVFFTAFAHFFLTPVQNLAAVLVMSIITLALIVGLTFDTIKKRGLQFFDKFLLAIGVLMLGVFDLVLGHNTRNVIATGQLFGMTFLPVNIEFFLLIFIVIVMTLERYADLDEQTHTVMNLLLWNLTFFALAIGGTKWIGPVGIIADICVAVGAVFYIVMTYFKLKAVYGEEPATKTPE
ncbi:MAG: hypothetical protein ACTSRE_08780 [Promethearchaeota archaeon]